METAEKTIASTGEVGAVSMSPSTSLLDRLNSTTRDVPGDWRLDRCACPISLGCTEAHDSLGKVMLSIWNLAQKGWVIFTIRRGDALIADVYVKPDKAEVCIKMYNAQIERLARSDNTLRSDVGQPKGE